MAYLLGYQPLHGRSSFLIACDCGAFVNLYLRRKRARCKECGKVYIYKRAGNIQTEEGEKIDYPLVEE